jgi:reactive intermediate/imine deaminase
MSIQQIETSAAPAPAGAYSQAVRAGDFVFVAGQGGADPGTGVVPEGIEAQTAQSIDNIRAILEAAGATLGDVVKVTTHLADVADFAAYDAVYRGMFPTPRPVRTTVGSTLIGIAVEIDVVAYVPHGTES